MKQKITILILKKKDIKDAIEIEMIVATPNDLVIAVVAVELVVAVDRPIAKTNEEKAKKKKRTRVEVDRLVTNMRKLPNMV